MVPERWPHGTPPASTIRHASIGIAISLAIALVAGRPVAELLFETSPRDPATFAAVAGVLLVVALLASGLRAWRAARVDPNATLRGD